jgi:hypothetical protein
VEGDQATAELLNKSEYPTLTDGSPSAADLAGRHAQDRRRPGVNEVGVALLTLPATAAQQLMRAKYWLRKHAGTS